MIGSASSWQSDDSWTRAVSRRRIVDAVLNWSAVLSAMVVLSAAREIFRIQYKLRYEFFATMTLCGIENSVCEVRNNMSARRYVDAVACFKMAASPRLWCIP